VAELTKKYGDKAKVKLIEGSGGQFEVVYNGEPIYSKKATGEFPRYGEIPKAVDQRLING